MTDLSVRMSYVRSYKGAGVGGRKFADDGLLDDGKRRLPINNEKNVRSSLAYLGENKGKYGHGDEAVVHRRMSRAMKLHGVDPYVEAGNKLMEGR